MIPKLKKTKKTKKHNFQEFGNRTQKVLTSNIEHQTNV